MQQHYLIGSGHARGFIAPSPTFAGLAESGRTNTSPAMFDSVEFLSRVLKKAGSQAAICRALDLPSSKVTLFFKPKGEKGHRRLTMEEGVNLAQVFDVPIDNRVSAERLAVQATCQPA